MPSNLSDFSFEGITKIETIIADNLELLPNGNYKVIDAKTSITEDLVNKASLLSTCTESQKVVYPLIDAIVTPNNKITKI